MNMDLSLTDGRRINNFRLRPRDIAYIAMFAAILFIQEEALTFIPNVQLTIFLLILYSKKMGFFKTSLIIMIHVALDNLVMGSFNLFYTPAMFVGWMFIPVLVCTVGRKTENVFLLGVIAIISSFLYCWTFIIPNYIFYKIDPFIYLASDIIFELILAAVGFLTTVTLYKPCSNIIKYFKIGE